jgi:hypothetical protein
MKKPAYLILSVACLLPAVPAHASEPAPLAKGLWEVTTRAEFKQGIPANPMPKIQRICLDDLAIKEGRIPLYVAKTCEITGGTWDNNKLALRVKCPDAPPEAVIPAELHARHKTFTSYIALNQLITYHHTGEWVSAECR